MEAINKEVRNVEPLLGSHFFSLGVDFGGFGLKEHCFFVLVRVNAYITEKIK